MKPASSYRGQPLIALMLTLGGWVAVRVMLWNAAMLDGATGLGPAFAARARDGRVAYRPMAMTAAPAVPASPAAATFPPAMASAPRFGRQSFSPSYAPLPRLQPRAVPAPHAVPLPSPPLPVPPDVSAAHQSFSMGALPRLPLPPSVPASAITPARPPHREAHWSADGWLLLRSGGEPAPVAGFAPATYGASQAGAVVRYRLAPENLHRPTAYLRASAALDGVRDREVAVGLSARPITGLPVVAAAEARVNNQLSGTSLRPAAFVYTELPPFNLPLHARGEFYGQAGYVGGKFATAFADGQLRVDHHLLGLGRGELRAGAGAWGGAQKGASRLDLGPTATLGMPIGGSASARLAVDWRFRVAGNAAPASGPALTLSAGF